MDQPHTITVTVELDQALVDLAREQGIDLSDVANRALRRALSVRLDEGEASPVDETARVKREIDEEVAAYNEHVERHGLFSDAWRGF